MTLHPKCKSKIQTEHDYVLRRCVSLVYKNEELSRENDVLNDPAKNFQRVQKFFGPEIAAEAVGFWKQKEAERRTQNEKF